MNLHKTTLRKALSLNKENMELINIANILTKCLLFVWTCRYHTTLCQQLILIYATLSHL